MKILILGGYGNAGILIAELLLQYTKENITLAGRNLLKAEATANRLNLEFNTDRVSSAQVDASNKKNLTNSLKNVNLIIIASSTLDYSRNVIDAAINEKVDYFDLQLSSKEKLEYLNFKKRKNNYQWFVFHNRWWISSGFTCGNGAIFSK